MSRPIKVVTNSRVSPTTKTTIEVTRTHSCNKVLKRKNIILFIFIEVNIDSEGYEKDTRLSVEKDTRYYEKDTRLMMVEL